jgi:hypothetical protein
MRWVARKAPLLTGDRGMLDSNFLALLFMTLKTEAVPFFEDKLLVLRSMGEMTGLAYPFFER